MAATRGRFRTKLCRNFALGNCPQGESCNYIHATPEAIQMNTLSKRSADDQASSTTFSPSLWPTLSPATNGSSDHFAYQWSNPSTAAETTPTQSHIKYRPLSWRTTLCRHFLKNRGWCPVGEECNYIHDLALGAFAKDDARFSSRGVTVAGTTKQTQRGKAGSKHSHCWAYIQGLCHVQDCPYLHPVAIHMFAAHTPCLAWPNCRRGPLCPYKHPEPYVSTSPEDSPVQQPAALPLQPPPSHPDAVPRGAMHYNGMFYYNVPQPPQPTAPPSLPPPIAIPPSGPQPPPMVFTNPWEAWQVPYTPNAATMPYSPVAMNPLHAAWQMPGHGLGLGLGLAADSGKVMGLGPPQPMFSPVAVAGPPPAFDAAVYSPPPPPPPAAPAPALANYTYGHGYGYGCGNDGTDTEEPAGAAQTSRRPPSLSVSVSAAPESEFPYVPPKGQRVGHARRVSVTIKCRSKESEDLDALGLDTGSHGRMPWQTHALDRVGRRSWAPSSSSALHAAEPTPPPMVYGM
ncbi:hypothetical protein GSI_09515 [Ganoderma sinense ZZ0214-1]|uniref:C3H1-type domain-containing protein n=1 Tax=Ganoderma sinense ZZ0214-1 TaxID=1077348 RepID=A0A2G8S3Q4_9APHY|nr:hypothetical protein GSI_09515 [Ganoderma sinense ZZ0214-1]